MILARCARPITLSRRYVEICITRRTQRNYVKTGMRRLRLEAQHIAVGHVVRNRQQAAIKAFFVGELEVFAPGKVSDRLRSVAAQTIGGRDGRGFCKKQRRSKLTEAVVCLRDLVVSAIGIRLRILAHAAMGRIRVLILKYPARLYRQLVVSVVRGL
jgi:hypothetical protein